MKSISQISIFDYSEIENLGDLERLKIFFENVDDNKLCKAAIGAFCPFFFGNNYQLKFLQKNDLIYIIILELFFV